MTKELITIYYAHSSNTLLRNLVRIQFDQIANAAASEKNQL